MVDYIIVGSGHEASILATKLTGSGKASVLLLKGKEYQFRRLKNWASKFWRSIKYNDPVAWTTERGNGNAKVSHGSGEIVLLRAE